MAFYSLISYHDPKIGSWTVPDAILGADEEAVKNFIQQIDRTIRAGKVNENNDGFECYRLGVFDDDAGKIVLFDQPQHLIDLHVIKNKEA